MRAPLDLGREQPFPWSGPDSSVDGEALPESEWYDQSRLRGANNEAERHHQWQESPVSPHQMSPHHVNVGGLSSSYQGERAPYLAEMPRWTNAQFDYGPQAQQMYNQQALGGSTSAGGSVSWSVPPGPSAGPPSPVQPSSPSSLRHSDKPMKHKSRKTWTEVEWKKLTDLAERSKRGNPEADIDWDYVTEGFNGRRCRQGILTVAAKRGLKVSTREARTMGKRARSTEDAD
ncbi:hypothetical protein FRB99_005667 [Tulasnella sp. 403]|nr:hypothetical protein FRB99_005667 [Tulasnella sp. 403]